MRRELGHVELTSNFSTTSAEADVTGMSLPITVGARPILIVFWTQAISNSSANNFGQAHIREVSPVAGLTADGTLHDSTVASKQEPGVIMRRIAPSAGDHTYKVTFGRTAFSGAGTATIAAAPLTPAILMIFEI